MRALQRLLPAVGLLIALAPASARAQRPLSDTQRDSLRSAIGLLERELAGLRIPFDSIASGGRRVEAGAVHAGSVVVHGGDLEVRGTVEGNAIAVDGNVLLHPGAVVRGDAVAIGGEVRADSATITGEIRSVIGDRPGLAALLVDRESRPRGLTGHAASVVAGWFLILLAIGFAVILLRLENLEAVASTISGGFARAFLAGLLGELLLIPALAAICVALAITLIGIPLIPLAIVAFLLAANGALCLGFLGMAFANGHALSGRAAPAGRGGRIGAMRYLLTGVSIYFGLWLLAALLGWIGVVGSVLKLVAAVVTWLAVTVGFGAVILSRAGTRRPKEPALDHEAILEEDYSWQTPTPVSGVAAARRPTPARPPLEP
ncbi:MAG TPA: polymer-forming cytoskeletal protein [Gemmatimonadaceae bacterium]|nr:polymer-forming cytoskeletal protein [Gemmatimonadaceae bacterium]